MTLQLQLAEEKKECSVSWRASSALLACLGGGKGEGEATPSPAAR